MRCHDQLSTPSVYMGCHRCTSIGYLPLLGSVDTNLANGTELHGYDVRVLVVFEGLSAHGAASVWHTSASLLVLW